MSIHDRQTHRHGATLSGAIAPDADLASVKLDEALDDRQAEPEPTEPAAARLQIPIEDHGEQLRGNTDSRIAYAEASATAVRVDPV